VALLAEVPTAAAPLAEVLAGDAARRERGVAGSASLGLEEPEAWRSGGRRGQEAGPQQRTRGCGEAGGPAVEQRPEGERSGEVEEEDKVPRKKRK